MNSSTNSALNVVRPPAAICAQMILIALVMLLSAGHVLAQTPDPQSPGDLSDPARPPLNPFPAEQDWSFLSHPALHPDFFDPAKYIRLGDGPQRYISFGLEYRTEYEYYDDWMFGAGSQVKSQFAGRLFARRTIKAVITWKREPQVPPSPRANSGVGLTSS